MEQFIIIDFSNSKNTKVLKAENGSTMIFASYYAANVQLVLIATQTDNYYLQIVKLGS
jgi:hypothetical protein